MTGGRRLADAAVAYARAGWRVYPMRQGTKEPIGDLVRHGYLDASSDPEVVATWWRWPDTPNIGLALPAHLVVVDLDRHDGAEHCAWTPERLPATLTTITGTGWHLWYRHAGEELRPRSEWPGWRAVEVKRHAVTLPPSVHANGSRYRWRHAPIDRLPALIADAFRSASHRVGADSERRAVRSSASPSVRRDGILAWFRDHAVPGNRQHATYWAAGRYRDAGFGPDDAQADLLPLLTFDRSFTERQASLTIRRQWR